MPVNWTITGGVMTGTFTSGSTVFYNAGQWAAASPSPSPPKPCVCGRRSDKHWLHGEDECTWINAGDVVPLGA